MIVLKLSEAQSAYQKWIYKIAFILDTFMHPGNIFGHSDKEKLLKTKR